ncbi:MAG: c-type cytochrome biogenesis protein CcmI [Sphingomonadales bacterium]
MLWAVFGFMTLGAVVLLGLPLVRRREGAGAAVGSRDLAVYRAQLKELEGDLKRGLLSETEGRAARLEIERRLLGAAGAPADRPVSAPARRWVPAAILGVLVPAITFGLYARLGSPDVPGMAFADQDVSPSRQDPASEQKSFAELIDRLARRLEEQPGNVDGWRLLGRSYTRLGQYGKAVAAFRRAIALDSEDADTQLSLAESLTMVAGGVVTPEAARIFARALELEPGLPGGRYYLALAAFQAGEFKAAHDGWLALRNDAPPDAPWLPNVQARLEEAAAELGIEPAPPAMP